VTILYLVLGTASLHLVREDLGTGLLRLRLVDVLHQNTLVLEDITLGLLVEGVVAESIEISTDLLAAGYLAPK
jgi:hypothetical protein